MKTNKNIRNDSMKKNYRKAAAVCVALIMCVTPAFAADDPLTVINNLSDYIFSLIKAVGIIVCALGVVQVGISFQSHDASQRTQGLLFLAGGLLIVFAKGMLTAIGVI